MTSVRFYCKYCGTEIKKDTLFCKNCGKSLITGNNIIVRINKRINLFSVLIGLVMTVIILLIGAVLLGGIIVNQVMDASLYIFLVLFFMLLLGGFTAGFSASPDIKDGLVNGGVLSLIFFIFLGIVAGLLLFVTIGISSMVASTLGPLASSTVSSATVPSSTASQDGLLIFKSVLIIITTFFAGFGGGALGSWVRGAIR